MLTHRPCITVTNTSSLSEGWLKVRNLGDDETTVGVATTTTSEVLPVFLVTTQRELAIRIKQASRSDAMTVNLLLNVSRGCGQLY